MSEDSRVQYKFMIPSSLKARLEDAAHGARRSLSAEIIERLEASFMPPDLGPATEAIVGHEHEVQMDEWKHMMADLRDLLDRHKP